MKKIFALAMVLLLAGCVANPANVNLIQGYENEPEVAWTVSYPQEETELESVIEWPELNAVVAIYKFDPYYSSDGQADFILEVYSKDSGDLLSSRNISDFVTLSSDLSDLYVSAMPLSDKQLAIVIDDYEYTSHAIIVKGEELDEVEVVSLPGGYFGVLKQADGSFVYLAIDSNSDELSFLDGSFEPIAGSPTFDIGTTRFDQIAEFSGNTAVLADLSNESETTFEFVNTLDGKVASDPITIEHGDTFKDVRFVGVAGDNFLFLANSGNGLEESELLLLSRQGEQVASESFTRDSGAYSQSEYLAKIGDRIYVLTTSRESFVLNVYDMMLSIKEEVDLDGVDSAELGYLTPEMQSLGILGVISVDEFALFDTKTLELTRFKGHREYSSVIGVGFSDKAVFVEEGDRLKSYDLELGTNWTFDLLEDESVYRAGSALLIGNDSEGELMFLGNAKN